MTPEGSADDGKRLVRWTLYVVYGVLLFTERGRVREGEGHASRGSGRLADSSWSGLRDPKRPKTPPRRSKTHPRCTQDAPRWPQDGPRRPQEGPKRHQDGPKKGLRGSRRLPGGSQEAPRGFQELPRGSRVVPKRLPTPKHI